MAFARHHNGITTTLNVLLGFLRMFLFLGFAKFAMAYVTFNLQTPPNTFNDIYITAINCFFLLLTFYDLVCGGSVMPGRGNFHDRIKLGKILNVFGLKGNIIDIFYFRCLVWFSLYFSFRNFPLDFDSFYSAVDKSIPREIFHNLVLVIAIAIFIATTIIWSVLQKFFRAFDHPWLSPYAFDNKTMNVRSELGKSDMVLFVLNFSYKILILKAILFALLGEEPWEDLFSDVWEKDLLDVSFIIFTISLTVLTTLREVYSVLNSQRSHKIKSLFIMNSFYIYYLLCSIRKFTNALQGNVYPYSLLAVSLINVLWYIISSPRRSVNLLFYVLKKSVSKEFMSILVLLMIYICTYFGFYLNITNFHKKWFDFNLELSEFLKELFDIVKALLEIINKLIKLMSDVMFLAFNGVGSILICALIVILFLVTLVLVILPPFFPAANVSYTGFKLISMMRLFKKFAQLLIRLLPNMAGVARFAKKVSKLPVVTGTKSTDFMGFVLLLFGSTPTIMFSIISGLAFFERSSKIGIVKISIFIMVMIIMTLIFVSFIFLVKLVIAQRIDLVLVVAEFVTTIHYTNVVVSYLLLLYALFMALIYLCLSTPPDFSEGISMSDGINSVQPYSQSDSDVKSVEIEEEEGPEVLYDTYLCKDLTDRCCNSKSPVKEKPHELVALMCRRCIPFCRADDHRTVCKSKIDPCNPCANRDDRETCFRRNKPLNLCGKEYEFDMADDMKTLDLMHTGKLALVIPYLLMIAGAGYLVYKVLDMIIYTTETNLGVFLEALLGDLGPKANEEGLKSSKAEQDSVCQQEISLLISALLGPIFKKMLESNPATKAMMDMLIKMMNTSKSSPFEVLFNWVAKGIFLWPVAVCFLQIVITTVVTSVYHNKDFIIHGWVIALTSVFGGLYNVLIFNLTVNVLFSLIPLINLKITIAIGWYYVLGIYGIGVFLLGMFTVDKLAEPIPPKRPLDIDDQIEIEMEDQDDPTGLNIERCALIVAGADSRGDDDYSFDT